MMLKTKQTIVVCILFSLLYGILTFFLSLQNFHMTYSDIYWHAEWVIEYWVDGSFIEFVSRLPYFGWHFVVYLLVSLGFQLDVAASLDNAFFNAITACVVFLFIKDWFKNGEKPFQRSWGFALILSIILLFVTAIYAPWFNPQVYLGQGSPNIWHNPTYIAVRPLALICVIYFNRFINERTPKAKDIVVLSLLVFISVLLKPSFIAVFLPACLVFAVIDYFFNEKDAVLEIKRLSIFILPCIAALFIFLRMFVLPNDLLATRQSSHAGIALSFFEFASRYSPNVFISLVLAMAFPVFSIIVLRRQIFKRGGKYVFPFIFFAVGLMEYAFVNETGDRGASGNFSWGYYLSLFIAWVYFLPLFIQESLKGRMSLTVRILGYVLICLHLISGIYYFFALLTGVSHL